MPATSEKQAVAARIALAVKKGKVKAKPGSASAQMAKGMSKEKIKHFTHENVVRHGPVILSNAPRQSTGVRMPGVAFGPGFAK